MDLTIKPLDADLLDHYLRFFDSVAFMDNPDWDGCYCVYYQHQCSADEWAGRTPKDNRNDAIDLIQKNILRGYLAFADDHVVGWCNVNGKNSYGPHLAENLRGPNDNRTAAIVCFVVAPGFRRQGVASKLLERTLADLGRDDLYDFIEAYPRKGAETDAAHYHGPAEMYLRAGFHQANETEDFIVFRKALR